MNKKHLHDPLFCTAEGYDHKMMTSNLGGAGAKIKGKHRTDRHLLQ